MSVSIGSNHFEDSIVDGQEGHIEGSTAKIKHKDVLLTILLVQAIGNGSSCGLVDNSHHIQSSNGSGILGCLTLSIVEVSWHSDDSMRDFLP